MQTNILIIIGKTCSGKDAVAKDLVKNYGFEKIVTTTTRPKRKGEREGINYNFVSEEDFLKKIEEHYFAEYKTYQTENGKWYYGTPIYSLLDLDKDKRYVLILTPQGFRDVKNMGVECTSIYLYANNQTIIKRLKERKDKNDSVKRRLDNDNLDFKGLENEVDKIVYNNDGKNMEEVTKRIIEIWEGK